MPIRKMARNGGEHSPLFAPGNLMPVFLVTALFLFWGVPMNMNDVLIKQFMKTFEITRLQAGLVQSAFFLAYFLLAVPSSFILAKEKRHEHGPTFDRQLGILLRSL